MTIPPDYEERVYAGVLGKVIGVYVGSPFEGWPYERILRELGEIKYYVNDRLGVPLIRPDDDISGTLTFVRAMSDYGNSLDLSPARIGQTWLNYLIEDQTVLWWGGMGNSTEHTAYLRLKAGVRAPDSGSARLNGRIVAEQIGAQIFIDGWAMIAPDDPELAADLARRAASVSHDGEAIYGAQVVAAMESQAFVERDIGALLDVGTRVIPKTSLIYQLIQDLREWRAKHADWRTTFGLIREYYGYDKYGGNCHMVPNHALIILALLYCEDSFQRAMTIVNTCGWDTDCNSGNVGCLMGIKNGLGGLDAGPDFRGPVADRLYLPTADGGRTMTDAAHEAIALSQIGRALAAQPALLPKNGARCHFDLPGAVQGFVPDDAVECLRTTQVENVAGHSSCGSYSLAVRYRDLAEGCVARAVREVLPTRPPSGGYQIAACPALYPGQKLSARITADTSNATGVEAALIVQVYGAGDSLFVTHSPCTRLAPGATAQLDWVVDVPQGCPIARVGLELTAATRADGTVYVDWLDWRGAPDVVFGRPAHSGERWLGAWVQAVTALSTDGEHDYRVIQNEGTGLAIQGTREWQDYTVSASFTPHLARSFGLAARVQGLRRYYALRLTDGGLAQLVRELDGIEVLAEAPYAWELYQTYGLQLQVEGNLILGWVDGDRLFKVRDAAAVATDAAGRSALDGGAIALLVEEGRLGVDEVRVAPVG